MIYVPWIEIYSSDVEPVEPKTLLNGLNSSPDTQTSGTYVLKWTREGPPS